MADVQASLLQNCIKVDDLITKVKQGFEDLKSNPHGDVTIWMDMARTCRQPQILWDIDYIEPQKELDEINKLIRESEIILYGNKTNIILKNEFNADLSQQSAFNTIRTHLRAEEGDFVGAIQILQSWISTQYDNLTVIRQSNLLFHACLSFLCCKMFEDSYECFEKHTILTKYADPAERIELGLWDNQLIMYLIFSFFIKPCSDFRDFFTAKTTIPMKQIWNHKKIPMLHFLEYDNSWIASFCGIHFYNHARELIPNLPKYELKRSTPRNHLKYWGPLNTLSYGDEINATGEEKYYYDCYNSEIDLGTNFPDLDKANNYLYSYYHYQNNYVEDFNQKTRLLNFGKKFIELDQITSILEAGCGVEQYLVGFDYLGIDISEKVCNVLAEKQISYVHQPVEQFIQKTNKTFDLCFASDLLNHLDSTRLSIFLKNCSLKCDYLLALIDTRDDFRSDIISKKQNAKQVNMHRTVLNLNGWKKHLDCYFKMNYEEQGPWIYAFGESLKELK